MFRSHYTDFRGEPLVLKDATASWPLVADETQRPHGVVGTLVRWLDDTPVQTLALHYGDNPTAVGHDLTFDTAQHELSATTFGEFIRRSCTTDDRRAGSLSRNVRPNGLDMEYLQKLRIPHPNEAVSPCHTCPGVQRLAASLSWPPVPCMVAALAPTQLTGVTDTTISVERETNLWAGRCLTSQLHFDGYDNIHR